MTTKLKRHILRQYGDYWYICWSDGKGTRRKTTGQKDRAKAEMALSEYLDALEKANRPMHDNMTCVDIMCGYLDAKEGSVVDHTRLVNCCKALSRHVGWMVPEHIKPSKVKAYERARANEGAQSGTIRRELSCLRAAMNWAVAEGWLDEAPSIKIPAPPPSKDRWLTREECDRLLEACIKPHTRLFVMIALHTGARKGAILDLTWDRVDFERRLIDFRNPGARATKKGKAVVPINNTLLGVLQEAHSARDTIICNNVIQWGSKPVRQIHTGFYAACREAGLSDDVTPHCLRHTAATHMAMGGADMRQISKMLGHSSTRITEDIYAHHSPDYLRDAAEKLG